MDKHIEDVVTKAAELEPSSLISEQDLAKINRYTLRELKADEVFTFSVILCDNAMDRAYEHFTDKSLEDMKKLFVGCTVIKDHQRSANNQIARIYDTEIIAPKGEADSYRQLKAHCYMPRLESNANLISEIEAGIKKEGSVSFRLKRYLCGICGLDNAKNYCSHFPGRTYATEKGTRTCTFAIDGVKDAFEFSLVAVPCQPAAGACKSCDEPDAEDENEHNDSAKEAATSDLMLRLLNSRLRTAANKIKIIKEENA